MWPGKKEHIMNTGQKKVLEKNVWKEKGQAQPTFLLKIRKIRYAFLSIS